MELKDFFSLWGGRGTLVSVPTQLLVHASRMSCVSDGTACAQKTFSVPETGESHPHQPLPKIVPN